RARPLLRIYFSVSCRGPHRDLPLSLHDALPISSFASGSKATAPAPNPAPARHNTSVNQNAFKRRRNVCGSPRASHSHIVANTREDRKSTRLNSSHVKISYAVFCLKKKKKLSTRE